MLTTDKNHSTTVALESNADKYANYVYKISINMIVPGYDKPLDITQFCSNISIPMNFDKHQFPFFVVNLAPDRVPYVILQQSYDEIRFRIDIEYCKVKAKGVYDAPKTYKKGIICRSLDIDNSSPIDEETLSKGHPSAQYPMTLILFDEKHLSINKPTINKIFHDISLDQVAATLLSSYTDLTPIVSKSERSTEKFKNILIPPMNLTQTLHYLQDYYGFYKTGIKTYADFSHFYLMANNKFMNKGEEYSTVFVETYDTYQSSPYYNEAIFVDTTNKLYRVRIPNGAITVLNDFVYDRDVKGSSIQSNTTTHSTKESTSTGKGGGGIKSPLGDKKSIINNSSSNHMAASDHIRKINETKETLEIVIPNAIMNVFSPEKKFHVKYVSRNNRNFEADYRLSYACHNFVKTPADEYFALQTRGTLVRF